MSEYPINSDLWILKYFTSPLNIKMLPAAAKIMDKLFYLQSSDKRTAVKHAVIKGYKGTKVKTLIFEPYSCGKNSPCLIFYHGGGFVYKASPYHYMLAREYAARANCKVIMPDYSLFPEVTFPVPAAECYNVYSWALSNSERLGIDNERIVVCGDSAGGALAAGVCLIARDRGLKLPCFQMLIYPALDRRLETASMKKYNDTPVWNSVLTEKIWEWYLPNKNIKHIEYASPMEAASLAELPDTYLETAEFDCLHDEGIAYANRLSADGCNVEIFETKGTMHGFEMAPKSKVLSESVKRRTEILKRVFVRER